MKKIIEIMGGIVLSLLSATVQAQQTTWDAKKNPTVDLIASKYTKLIPPKPALTTEDIFPVIGKYESAANTDAASVIITPDPENKGLVWVEGLPQGKIKAMLRKFPATYKIPAQQTENNIKVAEGTLIFDKDANTLRISIGIPYNALEPATAFTIPLEEVVVITSKNSKTKTIAPPKPWMYSGTKVEKAMVIN